MIARHIDTGVVLEQGDTIFDFRGDAHVFRMVLEENLPEGMVLTNHGKYFPGVFNLEIVDSDEEE